MKRNLSFIALLSITSLAFAEQPLVIEPNIPAPLNSDTANGYETFHNPLSLKTSQSEINKNNSLMLEYTTQQAKFANGINEDLKGFSIGLSSSPHSNGVWGKIEYQENSNYNAQAYEISLGGHLNLINSNGFYALGTIGTGLSILDADGFDTSVYWTLPIGLEAGYRFTPSLSLYTGIGYKWSFNITAEGETRCIDGTWSDSTGSGTCSSHGGIDYDYSSNYIGDYDGATYKAGFRYYF